MKRFLLLFIFMSILFGQDVLYLKSGEYKKGTCIEKVGNDIVFQVEGENIYTKFSIDLVEIIETNNRKYYYPFDIPTKQEYPFDISTKKEGNELAPIVLQFLFNPTPSERLLQNCMAIPCGFIMFIIAIALNPGSDS